MIHYQGWKRTMMTVDEITSQVINGMHLVTFYGQKHDCNSWHLRATVGTNIHTQSKIQSTGKVASFPGLPRFLFFGLRSVSYTEAEEREKRGRPGFIYHVRDVRWTRGGRRGEGHNILLGCAPPPLRPPASTWRHARDKWNQAFPVFRALPLPCITCMHWTQTEQKTGEAWEYTCTNKKVKGACIYMY